MTLQTSAKNS
nr:unnamed protein product [Callosobruchus chinensis]